MLEAKSVPPLLQTAVAVGNEPSDMANRERSRSPKTTASSPEQMGSELSAKDGKLTTSTSKLVVVAPHSLSAVATNV